MALKEGKESTEVKLAAAARRWRLQGALGFFSNCLKYIFKIIVQGASGEGAFDGMKVSYPSLSQNTIEMIIDDGFDPDDTCGAGSKERSV